LTELKQEFVDDFSKVRLSHGKSFVDLDIVGAPTGEIYQDDITNYKVRGHIMPAEVNKWLQEFFNDPEIFMIRSIRDNDRTPPKPNGIFPTDRISNFVTMAQMHLVNESSVHDLK
jgi:hypothetical protein